MYGATVHISYKSEYDQLLGGLSRTQMRSRTHMRDNERRTRATEGAC